MSIENPAALWHTALNELELQMTRATFDTWLRGTQCIGTDDEGHLIVEVKNEYAVEWLEHRLKNPIERTLQRITGNGTQAVYVAAEEEPPEAAPPPPPETPAAPPTDLHRVEERLHQLLERIGDREARLLIQQELAELRGDPQPHPPEPEGWRPPQEEAKKRGWFRVTQYASQFWGPYLGARLFRLWEIIVRLDKRRTKTAWTPPRRFSAPTLAKEVGCCRQTVSGTWRRCEPDDEGAILRTPRDTFTEDAEPEPEHFKRYPGLLERLADTGIARFTVEGVRSRKVYEVSVLTDLGWLTPAQLATLPAEVQEEHDRFVSEMGLDPNLWRIG